MTQIEKLIYQCMKFIRVRLAQRMLWAVIWKTGFHRCLSDEGFLKLKLIANTGEVYALPKDGGGINSAIVWMWLNWNKNPLVTLCVDKFAVRDYVRRMIGDKYLVPAIPCEGSYWTDANKIDFSAFPNKFVLKCNNGSQMNMFIRDKSDMDEEKVRAELSRWLKSDYAESGREMQYDAARNKIICEEFLPSPKNSTPDDYKFMCSDGEVLYIWVDRGRYTEHQRSVFDLDWNLQDVKYVYPHVSGGVPRPKNLDEMVEISRKLSKGIPLVRVDLYNIEGKIYFGELTFTSDAGAGKYIPMSWAREVAKKIKIPE